MKTKKMLWYIGAIHYRNMLGFIKDAAELSGEWYVDCSRMSKTPVYDVILTTASCSVYEVSKDCKFSETTRNVNTFTRNCNSCI